MNWYLQIKLSKALPKSVDVPKAEDPIFEDDGSHNWYVIDLMDKILEDPSEIEKMYPELKYLGSGAWGMAYDILEKANESGHVLKLTISTEEYNNALELMALQQKNGGALEHIAYVYNAQPIQENPFSLKNVYAIETERAQPLSPNEIEIVDMLRWFYGNNIEVLKYPKDINKFKAWEFITQKTPIRFGEQSKSKLKEWYPIFSSVFDKYYDLALYFINNNFLLNETHGNNIGKRQGTDNYILFDFGEIM